jgi:alkylmercury lyase
MTTLGLDMPIIDRIGRFASPTVLVDGVDVMCPGAGAPIGDACRLDLPTPQHVLDALRAAMPAQSAGTPQSVAESARQLPPAIRELHRAVLRAFRDSGEAHRDDLYPAAAALGVDLDDALRRLASADLVHTAPDGQIEIAYPFSGRPTGHTVHLTGHPPVAAMCAIDALGIPLMTGTDGVISSADPDTGRSIRIQRHGDEWMWQPVTTIVVIGQTDCCGTLANTVCRSITFHTDPKRAQSHLDNDPELHGLIVGQADAISLADCAFGPLLAS